MEYGRKKQVSNSFSINDRKWFECNVCRRLFVQKRHAISHLERDHNKPQQRDYQYEETSVNGKKIFCCNICGRQFRQKRSVVQHQNRDHNLSQSLDVSRTGSSDLAATYDGVEDLPGSSLNMSTVDSNLNLNCDSESNSNVSDWTVNRYSDQLTQHGDEGSESDISYTDHDLDVSQSSCSSDDDISGLDSDPDTSDLDCKSDCSSDDDVSGLDSDPGTTDLDCKSDSSTLPNDRVPLLENEMQALKILSCFQKHNLSLSASRDILETMRTLFPTSEKVKMLNLEYIYSVVNTDNTNSVKEVHYCEICNSTFPKDPNEFKCNQNNCDGLRYKGSHSSQNRQDRQPRKCFLIADISAQLRSLLKTPGVLQEIRQCKRQIKDRMCDTVLTDITDGTEYRKLLETGGFLASSPFNLTAVLNTDGVNLYSSSKVELWPLFIAINEISPKHRFARENLLLIGIWQGKGKPPFQVLMEHVGNDLNELYNKGVEITVEKKVIKAKLSVICGVFDLPAKASLLNMTFYNGAESCITCEEPGFVTKQGKGSARCYPYREVNEKAKIRTHEEVVEHMKNATAKKRVKGFKGLSGLVAIKSYDLVKGTVPDYMHCVLLGITHTLLGKWFSPRESGKSYFIGKHIKTVSKRLQNIKPPQSIERLPRDLEKHYASLKATELQAWLLFYAIPCLAGILPDEYLKHFAYLSESIYILLGDNISVAHLERSGSLLNTFYAEFAHLYGAGSCGLNVHNACAHLLWYVQLWGPIWAWSCFPFEDANATLLQSTHGTGNVTMQIMKYKQAESSMRQKGFESAEASLWKVNKRADNCDVCGKIKCFLENEISENVAVALSNCIPESSDEVKKVDRIRVNGKQFSSRKYSRMQRRICYIVLYESGTESVGSLEYFIYIATNNLVYAVIQKYNSESVSSIPIGSHIMKVKATNIVEVVPADHLIDTLVYINVNSQTLPYEEEYVALMPSAHGHAILK